MATEELLKEEKETEKEVPASETAAETAAETAEEPETENAEKSTEEAIEAAIEAAVEVGSVKKKRKIKAFTKIYELQGNYSDAQAAEILRKEIASRKEVHEGFLAKIAEENAFSFEKFFIPVCVAKAQVGYAWTTKTAGEPCVHFEDRRVEKRFCGAPEELRAKNAIGEIGEELAAAKENKELYPCKTYGFSQTVKAFWKQIDKESPAKKAKTELKEEAYELVYVPVYKSVCTYGGVCYEGYVNLVNGACVTDYRVSDRLAAAIGKTTVSVKLAKRTFFGALAFLLTFVALSVVQGVRKPDVQGLFTMAIVFGVMALAPVFSLTACAAYREEKLAKKAARTGRLPKTFGLKVLTLLSWLVCGVSVVLFALNVL